MWNCHKSRHKTIYRIYDKETGKMRADLICFVGEEYDTSKDLLLFDPNATWKKTRLAGGHVHDEGNLKACIYQGRM